MKPTNEIYPNVWNAAKRYYTSWSNESILELIDDKIPVSFLDAMEQQLNEFKRRS